jgi:hypothetical protein
VLFIWGKMNSINKDILNIIGSFLTPVNIIVMSVCSKYLLNMDDGRIEKSIPSLSIAEVCLFFANGRGRDQFLDYLNRDLSRFSQFVVEMYRVPRRLSDAFSWFRETIQQLDLPSYRKICYDLSDNVEVSQMFFEDEKFQEYVCETVSVIYPNHMMQAYFYNIGSTDIVKVVSNMMAFAKRLMEGSILNLNLDEDDKVDFYYEAVFKMIQGLMREEQFGELNTILSCGDTQRIVVYLLLKSDDNLIQSKMLRYVHVSREREATLCEEDKQTLSNIQQIISECILYSIRMREGDE